MNSSLLTSPSRPSGRSLFRAFWRSLTGALLALAFAGQAALPPNRDTTFQTQGMDALPNAALVLPDGKIVIAGNFTTVGGSSHPGLARLNADGSVDESFNPPIAANSAFGKPIVVGLTRLPDGKLLVAGQVSFLTTGAIARTNIIRFNADGSVDPTFNANGINYFTGLAVQADGKVLYTTFLNNPGVFGPARLNADGSPDSTFRYSSGITGGLQAIQLLSQPDGHTLVLQGDNNPNVGGLQYLFWLKTDGTLDNTFKFTSQLQDESRFAVAADGKLLVAAYGGGFTPQIQRLAADGTPDANFIFLTQPNNQGVHPVPAAFLPDGGAVVVRNPTAGDRRVSFFYLTPTGKLAGSLDLPNAGNVPGLGTQTTRAFAVQPDGKLLFAQVFVDGIQNVFGMFRLPVPPAPAPPVITVQPTSKSIGAGESLFLTVTATSGSPLTYQWLHAGTNLSGQTFQALSLGQNSLERAGDFQAVVGNAFGAVTSQVATITVRPPAAMVMTQQPVGGTVKLSQNFSLTAQCTTEVTTGYQWFKNNAPLAGGSGQGFGYASVNLPANDLNRTGDYFVVFTNDFGGALTSSVVHVDLILPGPPQLTTQPADLVLFASQPVQLAVTAVADGFITYQWQHAGTNLKTSPSIPTANAATLTVSATDTNRFGSYSVIVTVNPGGSTTSRVAQVTLLPSGPPVLLRQPESLALDFGVNTNLSAAFNGEAPVTVYWLHAGTNVLFSAGKPGSLYPTLDTPATNLFSLGAVPATAGDYLFVASNRFGSVTSSVATVTVRPPTPATITTDLTNSVVGIGEFNFVALRQGLVVTNLGNQETTHLLAFRVASGLPPFRDSGLWQLALGVSNRFYVGENSGAAAATGTWGFAPGANNYLALALTNFPRVGDISRLEALEDGRFGVLIGGNTAQAQGGTYRVLGARRPATNTFTLDVVSPNPVIVTWFKDGTPLDQKARVYLTAGGALGTPPAPGGVNQRYQILLPDVQPGDAGKYMAVVTNLFPNPDHTFGQPPYILTSATTSSAVTLTVRGFTETNAPPVVDAFEFGSPTALDEPTAAWVQADDSMLLGVRSTTFGGGSSVVDRLSLLASDGRTNWQAANLPAQIRAVLPDGHGGVFVGGHNNDSGDFFLNRMLPATLINGGKTNFTATNVWSTAVYGPSTNFFDNSGVVHGAEVVGLLPATDGVLVAGRFRGQSRFGATNVPYIGNLFYHLGGITLTNANTTAFDRSWDLYLAKYDLAGNIVWVRGYGGTNDERLTSFTTDAAGNLYLAGSFKGGAKFGSLTIESTKRVDSPTLTTYVNDGFLAKLTPDGTPVWVKNFGGTSLGALADTQIAAAVTDPAGGAYLTVTRNQSFATVQPGMAVGSRYLARVNPAGELQWAQTLEVVGNLDSFSGVGNSRLVLDADGNVALADAYPTSSPNFPIVLGAASVPRRPSVGTLLAKFAPSGTLLWARPLDEKLPFAQDPRNANTRILALSPNGGLIAIGSLAGGNSSAGYTNAGQRFDEFELVTNNNGTANPTDVFIARLAANFAPAAPQFTVRPVSQTGLLQDSLTLTGRATGVPAPSYQWLLNGVPVPGATNRLLTFDDLERTNRGRYSLVVSNAYGVVTSEPVDVTPKIRPNMTGWTLATSTTNYLGTPARVGVDDAGNTYVLLTGYANGGVLELRKFGPDGRFAWRYNTQTDAATTLVLSPFSPVVAASGEVFLAGRIIVQPDPFHRSEDNFLARINPADGSVLWLRNLGGVVPGQTDTSSVRLLSLDRQGHVRALIGDASGTTRSLRTFAFDGTETPPATLAFLPVVKDPNNARYAVDREGGIYFYANRIEAFSLGATNLAALGTAGGQSFVLARYDANGVFQWSRAFAGSGVATVTPALNTDAAGNLIIAGGLSLNFGQTFQIGTNQLTGSGYAAKITPAGDVAWAKGWFLNIRDAVLGADDSVYLTGWFRFSFAANSLAIRRVPFGTNYVAGSSVTGHDQFVAKLGSDGSEQFIRQTGSPDFSTFDNAVPYYLAVDSKGIVTTAGFTLVPHAGGGLDFGDLRFTWPDLNPYDIANAFGSLSCYYVARLQADAVPVEPPVVTFMPPQPGSSTLRLDWPAGYVLQYRASLTAGAWETLDVPPPYDAILAGVVQGYFRVVPKP
jgi:uncharacterized delta-60 repeat protein